MADSEPSAICFLQSVIIEMLTGKKPSEKVLEYSTMVGLGLLLVLLLYANGNDIYRFFIK